MTPDKIRDRVVGILLLALLGTTAGITAENATASPENPDNTEETVSILDLDFLSKQWQQVESLHLAVDDHIQATALSLLAFLNHGFDQKARSPFQKTIREMLDALLVQQTDSGKIGEDILSHIMATLALSEAMVMTHDPRLDKPCQLALSHLLKLSQQGMVGEHRGRWWTTTDSPPQRGDTRLTLWAAMACKAFFTSDMKLDNSDPLAEIRHWAQQAQRSGTYREEHFFPVWFNGEKRSRTHISFPQRSIAPVSLRVF